MVSRVRDPLATGAASTRTTLVGAAWLVAALGPPLLLILLLLLAWRFWGRSLWVRVWASPAD